MSELRAYWADLRRRHPSAWWETVRPAQRHGVPTVRYAVGIYNVRECGECTAQPYQAWSGGHVLSFHGGLDAARDSCRREEQRVVELAAYNVQARRPKAKKEAT